MRWTVKDRPDSNITEHLSKSLGIDSVLSSILAQRGIENFDEAKHFFRPSLDGLHDPFLMQDMQTAVERIVQALNQNEYIMIYGDYDVDGTTAVSLVFGYISSKYENITILLRHILATL